jgi:hypothetical protein
MPAGIQYTVLFSAFINGNLYRVLFVVGVASISNI